MENPNSIFLVSRYEDGKLRLFVLPHQTDSNNIQLDTNTPVTAPISVYNSYPEGTFFDTNSIVKIGNKYSVSTLYVLDKTPKRSSDVAPEQTSRAWDAYKAAYPDYNESSRLFAEEDDSTASEEKILGGTNLLETLHGKYPCPTLENDGFYVNPEVWDLLLRNVERSQPTLIYGCQGLGKTELVLALGKAMGKPVRVYDMGSMHDPMSQMLGTHRLVSDGTNTVSKFEMARFTQDIQQDCIILLDELNRAPVTTMNFLLPCMDSRRMLPVEGAFGESQQNIAIHPRCTFIATANIGSRHVGTAPIDPALWSRVLPIELEHLSSDIETSLLVNRYKIKRMDAAVIVGLANKTRIKAQQGELSTELSPRETLRAAALLADGFPIQQAMSLTFLPMFEKEERGIVKSIMTTR